MTVAKSSLNALDSINESLGSSNVVWALLREVIDSSIKVIYNVSNVSLALFNGGGINIKKTMEESLDKLE